MLEIKLLQISLGLRAELAHTPSDKEWDDIYLFAQSQSLTGLFFAGINRLNPGQRPPKPLLMRWLGAALSIQKYNAKVSVACQTLIKRFELYGCKTIILKGQSVAERYNEVILPSSRESHAIKFDLSTLRSGGDIDVWCVMGEWPKDGSNVEKLDDKWFKRAGILKRSRKTLAQYALNLKPNAYVQPHHVDFPNVNDIQVELHFTPTTIFNLLRNEYVQKYFEQNLLRCENHKLPVDVDFIFQLMHIRRHLIAEGIGLRQIIDLYITWRDLNNSVNKGFTASFDIRQMKRLGVWSLAKAMMWVLQIIDPNVPLWFFKGHVDEKRGSFIWKEIITGGNFGMKHTNNKNKGNSKIAHLYYYTRSAWRCLKYFPEESFWNPIYRIYVGIWRKQFRCHNKVSIQ